MLRSNSLGWSNWFFLLSLTLVISCNFLKRENDQVLESDRPLARVGKTMLYYSDLPVYCQSVTGGDSSRLVTSYVESWIRKQLLLREARAEIKPDDPEISEKIEEYANFLILQKFQERYISQFSEQSLSDEELRTFYASETGNYQSEEVLYKGVFIKVPVNTPGIKSVRENIAASAAEQEIKSFCVRYAKKYLLNTWFSEQVLYEESVFRGLEKKMKKNVLFEQSDSEYLYLVHVVDKVEKGGTIPLDYIKSDISNVIIRQKKLKAIKELENKMYDEAKESGDVEIF